MPPSKIRSRNPFITALTNLVNNGFENFGRYYSVYRAWVYDNEDPEKLGRLKLIIPSVTGPDYHDVWAHPVGQPSDKNFGLHIIPPKGAMVWVQFEGGAPEIPIWTHGHFGRNDIPTDDPELVDVNCYWFISPKGHKLKINDTKNTIHIKSNTGDIIEWNEKGVSVVTKKSINLGTLNGAKYSGVLGEELVEVLTDMRDIHKRLNDALGKDKIAMAAMGMTNTVAEVPLLKIVISGLLDKINKILSKLVTLD